MSRYSYTLTWRRNTLDVPIPEGWPTEKGDMLIEITGYDRDAVNKICDSMWWPGSGYSVHALVVDEDAPPPRKLSDEAKFSIRRKAIRRRVHAKNPMFAESEIDEAFTKNPDYFGGIRP